MKIVVSGSRYITSSSIVEEFVDSLPSNAIIYHGGCKGIDTLVGNLAKKRGLVVKPIYADWDRYGRAAGPIRNKVLLDVEPDLVVLFHEDLFKSRGTLNMFNEVKKRGIAYKYYQL